ncbi:MAG: molybdopterin-dependent oxidoreductase, partial [Pseudomonas sp.]
MSQHRQADQTPVPRYKPYKGPAGGWGALISVAQAWLTSDNALKNLRIMLKTNQNGGFDCPGCAWGDSPEKGMVMFCENGAKAVNWEATKRRVDAKFFAKHSVTALLEQSDYWLEYQGRLTEPMSYDAETDRYKPISWDDAFALIAKHLNGLSSPDQAEFYTSGRASNEAAYLYQLFVRAYGTNNFPDCSNMCHEATSRGLPLTVGAGKATVVLDDFEHADTILLFGHNAATNHPRMLGELRECARRGATIVSINPLRERGMERFTSPQHPVEMLTGSSTKIASMFVQPKLGGDFALIKGMAKRLSELDDEAVRHGRTRLIDVDFVREHTIG